MAQRSTQQQEQLLDVSALVESAPSTTAAAQSKAKAPKAAKTGATRRKRIPKPVDLATDTPIARVLVDTPLAHLDRLLDYSIPAKYDAQARPGVRVRVRLAGRLLDGFLVERVTVSEREGRLLPLERVVSDVAVLTPEIAALVRAVADRYAGTAADVVRAAVPPRHAATEALPLPSTPLPPTPPDPTEFADYVAGPALLTRLADSSQTAAPRAVLHAKSGSHVDHLVVLARATAATGRGVVIVVPDTRDVSTVLPAFAAAFGDSVATLTSDLGPAERYREFLRVLAGQARIVLGTRGAAFAPVTDPGLFIVWDDGDDLHVSPQAPFWHVREVLALRAHATGAAFVAASYARSVESQRLVETGWARSVVPTAVAQKAATPLVRATGDDASVERDPLARAARLPALAFDTARKALSQGPVLVQVPRRGYVPALACQRCRAAAKCAHCNGPLAATSGHAAPTCSWCGRLAAFWVCPHCSNDTLRAVRIGQRRTAEELGRAFLGTPVRTSAQGDIVQRVSGEPALVIATPGAEPIAEGGYAAALLLDAAVLLGRPDLRVNEEAYRRWANAVALVRGGNSGAVVVVGESDQPVVQALVRHDPVGLAERELADRVSAGLPPAVRAAEIACSFAVMPDTLAALDLPPEVVVLGPLPISVPGRDEPQSRVLLTFSYHLADRVLAALQAVQAQHDMRKVGGPLLVRVDPVPFG